MMAFLASLAAGLFGQEGGLRDRERTLTASRRIAEDLRKARLRYGPFYLLSSIELSDIGYDQQFFVPTTDQTAGFSFGLSAPQRLYFVPTKKTIFSVEAVPQYFQFRRTVDRRNFGFRGRADAQFLLNRLYADAYAMRNRGVRAETGEIARLVYIDVSEEGLTGEFKYSSRTSLTYSAVLRSAEHPNVEVQPNDFPVNLLDRSSHDYRVGLVHRTFPLTSLIGAAEVANYSFSNAVYKNSHRTYLGTGLSFDNGRSTFRLEAGPARLDFRRPDQRDFQGVLGTSSWTRTLPNRWALQAAVNRDVDFSLYANNNYYVVNRAALSAGHSVSRSLEIHGGTSFGDDRYDVPTASDRGLVKRRDQVSFTSVGWLYRVRRLSGGFDVGYYTRTSNVEVLDENGIRLILKLSFTP